MGDKISGYPVKTTVHGDDLLDFSNTEDSGSSYDESQKVTVDELVTYLNTVVQTLFTFDGTTGPSRAIGITDTLDFGTALFQVDETNSKVNIGFGLLAVDKTNGTINIKGAIDNTVRFTLRGLGNNNTTTSVLVEDSAASEMFKIEDDGFVTTRDGYGIGTDRFIHNTSTNGTYVGIEAGNVATGVSNTGIGLWALRILTSGGSNTAMGVQALNSITTTANNCAFGVSTLPLATGGQNAAFGKSSFSVVTTGNDNAGLGSSSGQNITSGDGNTCVGAITGGLTSGAYTNSIALGRNSQFDSNNQMVVGSQAGNAFISEIFWGAGISQTAIIPTSFTQRVTNIEGGAGNTDVLAAFEHIIAGAQSTGDQPGSPVTIQTAPLGVTGDQQNPLVDALQVDASTTSGDTRFLIYDVDNGTLERVTVGAADSGGTNFKVLRIPN